MKIANVAFRAMVERDRVVLHMENQSGRESSVDLIGKAFTLPRLCYSENWTQRRAPSGSPGWAVCHDSPREPRMFLGPLSNEDVWFLTQDFGLHRTDFLDRQVTFAESTAGQALKEIMLHDAARAAVYRKSAKWLDDWAERVVSEEPARPGRLGI
ncbi:hypothetical protein [Bradyrhizobium sp. CB1015]|uniref:hypothetical protein n=1 Tax=Bradyrhizobium sp. CB1015 TaxID=2976822 RepID=UPI0021AA5F12|nr:hypothetical protein [Bradyrhizobium sp. CB1015]UWU91448.1 hypothetical protein N2604_34240 [Bradyrhizobium sp. CB1015]